MKISAPATLTGLAVGNALGMPFEGCHYRDTILESWDGESFLAGEHRNLKSGQWAAATMMAKALAASLLAHRTYAPSDAAKRYLTWYQLGEPDHRGMGKNTAKALSRLDHGLPWTQSGQQDSLGNGAAVRIAPMGLLFQENIQAAAEMSHLDAQITHKHPEAVYGSVAMSVAVCALAQGRAQPLNVINKILGFIPEGAQLAKNLRAAQTMILDDVSSGDKKQLLLKSGSTSKVTDTVPNALLAFAATESYREAVETAIRAGGDTDTVAAMTGALAGTFYGFQQVEPYFAQLESGPELRALECNIFNAAPPMYQVKPCPSTT